MNNSSQLIIPETNKFRSGSQTVSPQEVVKNELLSCQIELTLGFYSVGSRLRHVSLFPDYGIQGPSSNQ